MITMNKSKRNTKVQVHILAIFFRTESCEERTVGISISNLGDPATNLIPKTTILSEFCHGCPQTHKNVWL